MRNKRIAGSSLTHIAVDIEGAVRGVPAKTVGQAGRVGVGAIVKRESYLLGFLACREDWLRVSRPLFSRSYSHADFCELL